MTEKKISKNQLRRIPFYLNYLKQKKEEGVESISSPMIAFDLHLNEEQVRKDIALISSTEGKPGRGRNVEQLMLDASRFLGYDNVDEAILVGAGQLGKALLSYKGFEGYGINIIAAFDVNPTLSDVSIHGKAIYPMEKMKSFVKDNHILIGIITVPAEFAQSACDALIDAGVLAIWNFAPIRLNVPEHIIIQNENMASSLAILSKFLQEKLNEKKIK